MARASYPSTRQRTIVVTTTLTVMLILAACGSEIGEDEVVETIVLPNSANELSPLEQRLGFSSDASKRQRQQIELQRQAEVQVAVCMTNRGFDYVPAAIDET